MSKHETASQPPGMFEGPVGNVVVLFGLNFFIGGSLTRFSNHKKDQFAVNTNQIKNMQVIYSINQSIPLASNL